MMKLVQLRQGEISSGYGSRESLVDGSIPASKQNDVVVQQPNSYCNIRSGSSRKTSSSKGTLSPHSAHLACDLENSGRKSQHSHNSLLPTKLENNPNISVKKSHRHSHCSLAPTLDNETVSSVKRPHRHSHCSLTPAALENEKEKQMHRHSHSSLAPSSEEAKNSVKNTQKHSHSSLSPVLDNETLSHINEDLVLRNKALMEENSRLVEELQILRRFFQGTLNDLNLQLSAGENKIMLLQETVGTYKETLTDLNGNTQKLMQDKEELIANELINVCASEESSIQEETNCRTNIDQMVMSRRKCRKRSDSPAPRKLSQISSTAPSSTSESSCKSGMSLLHGRNFTKVKEKLVEKNLSLKTDIALLKVKVKEPDAPINALVPLQIEEVKPHVKSDDMLAKGKENVPLKENLALTSEVLGKRLPNKDRSLKRINKSEKNKSELETNKTFSTLQQEGTLTLEEHKEKLVKEYKTLSDHSAKEKFERTQ